MSIDLSEARAAFERHFGVVPTVGAAAPGRVNIIGEHTDYNHGFVLPMAIEQETVLVARPRGDRFLHAYAANLDRAAAASLDDRRRNPDEPWMDYLIGVADELARLDKPLSGADVVIMGDVPIGCGLSSSASLEMAALVLFETLGGFRIEGAEAPKLGRRVENEFLGLSTGIMDQFISRMGRAGHALFLDCRSYAFDLVPVDFDAAVFVIANTCVARGLTSSKYNERVAECGEAVQRMARGLGKNGTHLRDFELADLEACRDDMPERVFRRARHVISEDARTRAACDAMRVGDAEALGALMTASDISLRDDYEVTCKQLDVLTAVARELPGCFGARMTGAGFGGCTINLVDSGRIDGFLTELMAAYAARTGIEGQAIVSKPAEGARPLAL
ncbi:MAG TPA: galactokinase [Candidatus Hydrogenedentes bacterium]|nr:galactokinase [Candidatus Hydrogenedentota bacterium]HPG69139.1 galactokinase [Candidatus Hydrogenedentota bacterium]